MEGLLGGILSASEELESGELIGGVLGSGELLVGAGELLGGAGELLGEVGEVSVPEGVGEVSVSEGVGELSVPEEVGENNVGEGLLGSKVSQQLLQGAKGAAKAGFKYLTSKHCIHCKGDDGPCQCAYGCAIKSKTACSAAWKHCQHCRGIAGYVCSCRHGCPARGKTACHHNYLCDVCGMSGIPGSIYICKHCPDYGMCGNCYQEGQEHLHHSFARRAWPGAPEIIEAVRNPNFKVSQQPATAAAPPPAPPAYGRHHSGTVPTQSPATGGLSTAQSTPSAGEVLGEVSGEILGEVTGELLEEATEELLGEIGEPPEEYGEQTEDEALLASDTSQHLLEGAKHAATAGFRYFTSKHCIHCKGDDGPCQCAYGCAIKSKTACSAAWKHCQHCRGLPGYVCSCRHGCPAKGKTDCNHNYLCDVCGMSGIAGSIYICKRCPDYGMCGNCYQEGQEHLHHPFARRGWPGAPETIEAIRDPKYKVPQPSSANPAAGAAPPYEGHHSGTVPTQSPATGGSPVGQVASVASAVVGGFLNGLEQSLSPQEQLQEPSYGTCVQCGGSPALTPLPDGSGIACANCFVEVTTQEQTYGPPCERCGDPHAFTPLSDGSGFACSACIAQEMLVQLASQQQPSVSTCDQCGTPYLDGSGLACSTCFIQEMQNVQIRSQTAQSEQQSAHPISANIVPASVQNAVSQEAAGVPPSTSPLNEGMKPRHPNVRCDVCGTAGVVGSVYHCAECPDFDMCEECYQTGKEHLHHSFSVIASPGAPANFVPARASSKPALPASASLPAPPKIVPAPVQNAVAQEAAYHRNVRCDVCGTAGVVGSVYRCAQCPDFDMCGGCYQTGKVHLHHSFSVIASPGAPAKIVPARYPSKPALPASASLPTPPKIVPAPVQNAVAQEAAYHRNVRCDVCGTAGVVGSVYRCAECPDFDMCGGCYQAGKVHLHHSFSMLSRPGAPGKFVPARYPSKLAQPATASSPVPARVVAVRVPPKPAQPAVAAISPVPARVVAVRVSSHSAPPAMASPVPVRAFSKSEPSIPVSALPPAVAPVRVSVQPTHPNVMCDVCGTVGVVGSVYSCAKCPEYDMCERCYQTGKEHLHHSFSVLSWPGTPAKIVPARRVASRRALSDSEPEASSALPPSIPLRGRMHCQHCPGSAGRICSCHFGCPARTEVACQHNKTCDLCYKTGIAGSLYHCKECPDYDICSDCYAAGQEHLHHSFAAQAWPGAAETVEAARARLSA